MREEGTEGLAAQDAAEHVGLEVPPAAVDRAWERVEARLERRPRSRLATGAGAVALAAVAAAALFYLFTDSPTPAAHATKENDRPESPEAPAVAPEPWSPHFEIREQAGGSVIALSPSPTELTHRLRRGAAEFDVEPCADDCPGRRTFVVLAASVRVEVVGTQFAVELFEDEEGPYAVEVRVRRGTVSVASSVGEGELPAPERLVHTGDELRISLAPRPGRAPELASAPTTRRRRPPAARAETQGPRELFAAAREADRGGDLQAAIGHYQRLLAEHPGDARAALAAYELGRIRMDRQHDLPGAARAFERARTLAPRAALSDDAMARLVRIYERVGPRARCQQYRDTYLSSFEEGRHRADVEARCR